MAGLRCANLESFKLKLPSLQPLMQQTSSIHHQFSILLPRLLVKLSISRKYESIKCLTLVNEYLSDMIKYLCVIIDNGDLYCHDSGFYGSIVRDIPSGGIISTRDEINNLDTPATYCINIIDKRSKPK